jgi:hypothetical protein
LEELARDGLDGGNAGGDGRFLSLEPSTALVEAPTTTTTQTMNLRDTRDSEFIELLVRNLRRIFTF